MEALRPTAVLPRLDSQITREDRFTNRAPHPRAAFRIGPAPGNANTSADALFVDADGPHNTRCTHEDDNFRLAVGSSCIDAGVNEDWMWETADRDGNPRILVGLSSLTVDIGPYEYRFTISGLAVQPAGVELQWIARSGATYAIGSSLGLTTAPWVEEATVRPKGGLTTWTDPAAMPARKFYRIEIK